MLFCGYMTYYEARMMGYGASARAFHIMSDMRRAALKMARMRHWLSYSLAAAHYSWLLTRCLRRYIITGHNE